MGTKKKIATYDTDTYNESDSTLLGVKNGNVKRFAIKESKIKTSYTATRAVGGIAVGDEINAGDDIDSIVKEMLHPVEKPTLTNPSATLSISPTTKTFKKGTTHQVTFTLALNRGSISPQYTAESPYRSGAATEYRLAGETLSGSSVTKTVSESKTSYQGEIDYAAGVQPKDADGNDYKTPLPAGTVTTNTITFTFVSPYYRGVTNEEITAAVITGLTEVVESKGNKEWAYTATAQHGIFAYPKSYGVLQHILDPNGYENISGWTRSEVTIDGTDYYVYRSDDALTCNNFKYKFQY